MNIKKTADSHYRKEINEPFTVDTSEDTMWVKAGDCLMQGINGEMYVCPPAILEMGNDILNVW